MAGHRLLKGLLVTDAGYFPAAEGHRVERPHGATTHLLIICLAGRGWVRSAEKESAVAAGEVVWLPADQEHAYGAAEDDPWKVQWAHFRGEEVEAWRTELGWAARSPFGQARFDVERVAMLGLEKAYGALEEGYSLRHLLAAAGAMRSALGSLLELGQGAGRAKTAEERTAAVRDEIVAHPERAPRLEELATLAGLSVPHFSVLFRRQTGYAPIDFAIRQRIRAACRLLDTTRASITDIAAEAGFEDPYYFSRCFRRVMGTSPRAYRQRVKG